MPNRKKKSRIIDGGVRRMQSEIIVEIKDEAFSLDELVSELRGDDIGAVVIFLGVVRKDDGVVRMEIEAYDEIASAELEQICREAIERFSVSKIRIVHRKGRLSAGDNIVAVIAAAKHRRNAFRACEYLIDELKRRAPIWKKEILESGEGRWVLPESES
ncbi:MAG: Molybdopterin synthase catalytic subunit MoaE [Candidatus Alkanophagales archaeon MCA70_species_1]|nr:Molybdopterin synthase catalytic subunit MoaE [Candidatus Alkanophaga volatiphilum]